MFVVRFLGQLQDTRYRSICRDTRTAVNFFEENWKIFGDMKNAITFYFEYGLYKYPVDAIMQILWTLSREGRDFNHAMITLDQYFIKECHNPNLKNTIDLLPFIKAWDAMTSTFYTSDYSLHDMGEQGMVFKTFSTETLLRGIKECKPGVSLNYLKKCLESIRSEGIKDLRKDERQLSLVNASHLLVLPTYRKPGLISAACEEEEFLNAL